jgi:hypothetical protein
MRAPLGIDRAAFESAERLRAFEPDVSPSRNGLPDTISGARAQRLSVVFETILVAEPARSHTTAPERAVQRWLGMVVVRNRPTVEDSNDQRPMWRQFTEEHLR